MKKRSVGRTGLEVTELALGTWGLSGDAYGKVEEKQQDAVIERALAHGINLFETADVYAEGNMETKLGERLPNDDTCLIATKIGTDLQSRPSRKRFDVDYLKRAVDACRKRQGRDVLDIVLLHNPSEQAMKDPAARVFLEQLFDDGKIKAWGVSAGAQAVVMAAIVEGPVPHIVQMPYNAFFRGDLRSLDHKLKQKSIAVFARSVLAHGLLAGFWPSDKSFEPEDHRSERWSADQLRRRIHQLRAMNTLRSSRTPSMRAAAVGYVLNNPRVTSAILGPRSVVQLDQLVREVPKEAPYLEGQASQHFETQANHMRIHS
jgi:aryl-alcohol dehydrogenase-like predicted oxidoreductase